MRHACRKCRVHAHPARDMRPLSPCRYPPPPHCVQHADPPAHGDAVRARGLPGLHQGLPHVLPPALLRHAIHHAGKCSPCMFAHAGCAACAWLAGCEGGGIRHWAPASNAARLPYARPVVLLPPSIPPFPRPLLTVPRACPQSVDDPARKQHNPNPKWPVPVELIEWQPVYHQRGAKGGCEGLAPQGQACRRWKRGACACWRGAAQCWLACMLTACGAVRACRRPRWRVVGHVAGAAGGGGVQQATQQGA